MKFGFQINPYVAGSSGNPWDVVAEAARLVDHSVLDSLWVYDHFLYEGGYAGHPVSEPVMECFTTLAALAATTERIRLGQLVVGVPYRNPALMTKMATTLDLISRGRSILGLGAGWHEREHEAYGWGDLEAASVRMRRLDEAIQVVLALWTERPARFEGEFYQVHDAMENPAPIQRPHPPILIGGDGEKVTLRLVAQYGQFCNLMGDAETVRRRFRILRDHCERVGRPYDEVTRSVFTSIMIGSSRDEVAEKKERLRGFTPDTGALSGIADELIGALTEYAEAGCQYMIFRMPDWADIEPLQMFLERVVPAMSGVATGTP